MTSSMRRGVVRAALVGGMALVLGACGADSHSVLPAFLRAQASDPPQPEPRPDVKKMVREQLDSVFIPASQPQQVRVSLPQRDLRGPGWSACVKAELTSAMGKPLGPQTYRITIEEGTINDRRRVGAEDNCDSETYDPI
jgi:hypothetical protein